MSEDTAEGYLQRAQLLAELGRYDEAAEEVGYAVSLDPANAPALTMLARAHLAADRPAEALGAADRAVAAAPGAVEPLVTRALALADLREYAESARTADRILEIGPADPYAQRSAAAILAGARNGQPALDAAWRGVELAPEEPQAHLVLGLVAARLQLYDLAARAYAEALRLDPTLEAARHDVGVMRLERRRWAVALEELAEQAPIAPEPENPRRTVAEGLRRLVLFGGGFTLAAAVCVAAVAPGSEGVSRVFGAFAALVGALLVWRLTTRVPDFTGTVLPGLRRTDRTLTLAVYAVAAAPALLLLYTLVGTPWPLVAAIAAASAAELALFSRLSR